MEDIKDKIDKLLDKAQSLAASYADVRYQRFYSETIGVEDQAQKGYHSLYLTGLGIRVVCNVYSV